MGGSSLEGRSDTQWDDRFPATSWTLLYKAREQSEEGTGAREALARRYYRPVQEFLCVLVRDCEKAQDLTQEFFTKLSGPTGLLERASPDKGRFQHFVKQALRNLVIDHHRRHRFEILRTHSEDEWVALELAELPAAEAAFHREWVKGILAEALNRVRVRCLQRGQSAHLDLFEKRYLSDPDNVPSWEELGAVHGLDQRTARERADTVIRQFRMSLRHLLRNEIEVPGGERANGAAIDQEIKALLSPLQD